MVRVPQAVPPAPVEDEAAGKPTWRGRQARGNGATGPPPKARKRREGWNDSVYRRPRDGAAELAEVEDGSFIEDPLDDIGRG